MKDLLLRYTVVAEKMLNPTAIRIQKIESTYTFPDILNLKSHDFRCNSQNTKNKSKESLSNIQRTSKSSL